MPAPPPPPPPVFCNTTSDSKDQGRSLLLQSIRAGKSLKKTVTVDKSAPPITGKIIGETSPSSSTNHSLVSSNNNVNSSFSNGAPTLGGLFSGGMPKLKPTGLRGNMTEKDSICNNTSSTNVITSVKRGPPPLPPPAAQKPQIFSQASNKIETSNTDIPRGFGKPNIAPKPPPVPPQSTMPRKPSPPPKKLNLPGNTGITVSRAQSMRLARSSPALASPLYSLHQSQDRLNETQQPQTMPSKPVNRALKPPVAKPPSPPKQTAPVGSIVTGSTLTTTRVAPPPPSRVTAPSIPPPPPPLPFRSAPPQPRTIPPPSTLPASSAPSLPPTPPTRNTTVRNGQLPPSQLPPQLPPIDLEIRFADLFHPITDFISPEPFRGVTKIYNSRNAKHQAPPPPPLRTTSDAGTMH